MSSDSISSDPNKRSGFDNGFLDSDSAYVGLCVADFHVYIAMAKFIECLK